MAKIEFNVTWWKKNGAKTLTDTGMSEALRDWEKDKKSDSKIVDALDDLSAAAAKAEAKANKSLHKETIAYLQLYQKKCAEFKKMLKAANGSSFTPSKILSKPILDQIGSDKKGQMYVGELLYLFATKSKPGECSKKIYDTFLSSSAKYGVNISAPVQKKCDELAKAGTWKDDGWAVAHQEVYDMSFDSSNLKNLRAEVLSTLEREPILAEIRAA